MFDDKERLKELLGEIKLERKLEEQRRPELEKILISEPNEEYRRAAVEYFQSIGLKADFTEGNFEAMEKIKKEDYRGVILTQSNYITQATRSCLEKNLPTINLVTLGSGPAFEIYYFNKEKNRFSGLDCCYGARNDTNIWGIVYDFLKKIIQEKEKKNV